MANFSTHFNGAMIASAALSSVTLSTGITDLYSSFWLFTLGTISGLFPDLDADNSRSQNWLFYILTLCIIALTLLHLDFHSLLGMWLSVLGVIGVMFWVIKPLFEALTVHRGSLHSLSAVLMCALGGTALMLQIGYSLNLSMLSGIFITLGMMTHLILDECYSVDIDNVTLKKSFGTALKPIDIRFPLTSAFQVLVILVASYHLFPFSAEAKQALLEWQTDLLTLPVLPLWFKSLL